MLKTAIIAAILQKMGTTGYSIWTIGVTDDPETRKSKHTSDGESTKYWSQWKADSERDARDIEKYFLDKGMKGGSGGPGTADYVYVF